LMLCSHVHTPLPSIGIGPKSVNKPLWNHLSLHTQYISNVFLRLLNESSTSCIIHALFVFALIYSLNKKLLTFLAPYYLKDLSVKPGLCITKMYIAAPI
jgi:hypothetical protein